MGIRIKNSIREIIPLRFFRKAKKKMVFYIPKDVQVHMIILAAGAAGGCTSDP